MEQKKAAIYIRVSTDAQREEGYSIEAQKEMLTAYCVSKQIKHYELYIDGGFSGSNIERPEMQRLIDDAKNNMLSHVIVYKLDRLSRSQKDTLYLIEDVFNPHGVDFISMQESMDTSTPLGRLMLGILSAFAQLERENIKERTRMGMKERVKNGLWMGGGRIPYGYDYDKDKGVLVPNKDAETVRKVYSLYLQGYSLNKIAQMVGLKYERLARQILMRKSNAGYICYNGEEYQGKHEPIVSIETYYEAMALMQRRSFNNLTTSGYLLTGLMYCGKCGAKLRYQKWGKAGTKIVCYSRDKSKPHLVKNPECDNEALWSDKVETAVVNCLFELNFKHNADSNVADDYDAVKALNDQYETCAAKIKRLYNLYAASSDDILLETIEQNKKELEKLKSAIKLEQERSTISNKYKKLKKEIENISELWEYMTSQEQQKLIRELINKITITDGRIDIEFVYDI